MKEKRDHKGGRTPLPDEEKRKNLVATKLTDIKLEVARAKAEAFKMTVYELLKEALNRCAISVKQYDEFVKIVDSFSLYHLTLLCINKVGGVSQANGRRTRLIQELEYEPKKLRQKPSRRGDRSHEAVRREYRLCNGCREGTVMAQGSEKENPRTIDAMMVKIITGSSFAGAIMYDHGMLGKQQEYEVIGYEGVDMGYDKGGKAFS